MHLDLTDPELDYLHRLLLTRPMGEVEGIVASIRKQVAQQQPEQRALPNGNAQQPQEAIQ